MIATTTPHSGGKYLQATSAAGAIPIIYQGADTNGKDGGVGTISFWYRSWDGSPAALAAVQINVNGGGWIGVGVSITCATTVYA